MRQIAHREPYVFLSDDLSPEGPFMEFRLVYSGPLYSTANDVPREDAPPKDLGRSLHKHALRMAFHPQMKALWEGSPFLQRGFGLSIPNVLLVADPTTPGHDVGALAGRYRTGVQGFVPLVTKELALTCSVDVLMLRPDQPGGIVAQGDLDGRLKALLDGLSVPVGDAVYAEGSPHVQAKPIFSLLADDRLVTSFRVETDRLLEPGVDRHFVRLVLTVRIRPWELHLGNLQFA